ncbi:MAG: response regulator [Candidatus Omnitrophota bacterium]
MAKEILIIDDEPDILALAVTRLETSGYKVITAVDAEKAWDLLAKNMPDLILLDLLLPIMQGDEFCKKLKSDSRFKHIPVILFTASTIRSSFEKIQELGADDCILKPFEADELLRKIKKFIN